jgi:alpha-L-rhamnosidase
LGEIDALVAFRPDIIFVEFAVNDAALHRRISLRASIRNLTTIIERIGQALPNASCFVMAMNPVHGPRALLRPRLNAYVEAHRQAAATAGAGFIDHRPQWLAHSKDQLWLMIPDGLHPIPACAVTIMLSTMMERLAVRLPSAKELGHV